MPILDLPCCICGCQNIACFKVFTLRSPCNICERMLWSFRYGNCLRNSFFLHIKYQYSAISSCCIMDKIPAAIYRSRGSNLMVDILTSYQPSTKSGDTLIVELGTTLMLYQFHGYSCSLVMGGYRIFSVISYIIYLKLRHNTNSQYSMQEGKFVIEAIAVIDIDPTLTPFSQEQQKWLTSIEIVTEPPRERINSKHFTILPGVFLALNFCEKNKDPIYEVQFTSKPGYEWNIVKIPENIQALVGSYLCYKTELNLVSGPICDIDLLNIQKKSRYGESKEILNVPHSYKLISHQLPFGYLIYRKVKSKIEQSFKAILAEKYLSARADRINLSQLPLFCFPEGIKIVRQIRGFLTFNFIFTLETAERIFVTCLVFKEQLDEVKKQKLEVLSNQQLFYEKALCILSNECFTDQFGQCLQHLYRLSMSKSEIPFWRVVQTFVNELMMPSKQEIGNVGITYCYGGNKINFPTNSQYPFVSQRALYSIFKFMSVDNIISVFESLLLERKVFFVSQSKTILGYATQAFLGLLYPFKWQQVLIPILPTNLKEYLTAPVPLVAGISPSLVDLSIQSDSVIVYLDKNQILNDEDNPPLPEKLFKQLSKRLEKLQIYDPNEVTEFLQNPESTYLFKMQEVQDPHFHGHLVRDSFFEFLLTLMKNYKKFLSKPKMSTKEQESMFSFDQPTLMTNIFKVQDFLSDLNMTKVGSFGYKFTESSIFTSFIERKCQKSNDPQLLFFDQCIERKKNKKQTAFIVPISNKAFRTIRNPEVDPQDAGPFFYNQFPSLYKQPVLQEQQIELKVVDNKEQQQNRLVKIIQEEFHLNNEFFESFECEDQLLKKMLSLLLNKNKPKMQSQDLQNKVKIINWFLVLYEKQMLQIQTILVEWPAVTCEQKFKSIKKIDYLKSDRKGEQNCIIGVEEGLDYQILLRKQTKIIFVGSGIGSLIVHKSSSIVIQILSHRIKEFINSILKKQAGFFIDFCEKQAAKDIRASALRKASEQTWNIETIIAFKNWLHYEKQFATGITGDQ